MRAMSARRLAPLAAASVAAVCRRSWNLVAVDNPARLEFVWNNQIVPLLEEYFYANREQLARLLAPFRADDESEADAVDDVEPELGRETGDEMMRALTELVEAWHEP